MSLVGALRVFGGDIFEVDGIVDAGLADSHRCSANIYRHLDSYQGSRCCGQLVACIAYSRDGRCGRPPWPGPTIGSWHWDNFSTPPGRSGRSIRALEEYDDSRPKLCNHSRPPRQPAPRNQMYHTLRTPAMTLSTLHSECMSLRTKMAIHHRRCAKATAHGCTGLSHNVLHTKQSVAAV